MKKIDFDFDWNWIKRKRCFYFSVYCWLKFVVDFFQWFTIDNEESKIGKLLAEKNNRAQIDCFPFSMSFVQSLEKAKCPKQIFPNNSKLITERESFISSLILFVFDIKNMTNCAILENHRFRFVYVKYFRCLA